MIYNAANNTVTETRPMKTDGAKTVLYLERQHLSDLTTPQIGAGLFGHRQRTEAAPSIYVAPVSGEGRT